VRLGVGLPHPDLSTDPAVVRDFAQAAENAGFDYLSTIEHVAGAHADRFVGIDTGFPVPPYLYDVPFHEPFTLFAYLAGFTSRIELVTSVLVIPQRQTVLVAKQAAEVSLLSDGRLRLGIGVGWNHTEYEALGADFHTRGQRQAEQIDLLRKLWTEPIVTFAGRWHTVDRIGIAPLPRHPIPIWIGGGLGESTLRRVARLADGWMPAVRPGVNTSELIARMQQYLEEAGRESASLGIQAGIDASGEASEWVSAAKRWEQLGATHLSIVTVGQGSGLSATQGLDQAIEVKRVLGLELGY
jgi:probable F420-dependent oxidoreductase